MKITIENFGPIHKFEIDLSKNISLIYGKNNIGKKLCH
ncbi:MAG: AAA family ATPase [Ignavibacteriales bacterium]|nr:AAA family ATPase [Ignavibacteriales bacterium]